ncbi:MAG: hypothetical protein CSA33_03380 [Desulfobulbus propionicus]|nr:MAG: hypothetical protein CSA33_03380 [Desulfobulbus propionicus]
MKVRDRVDKIIHSCQQRIQEEVSTLLGKNIVIGTPQMTVTSQEACLENLVGSTVLAHLSFDGEIVGHGGILVSVQDAIRIGGTLIMLPDSELQSAIADEKYSEELQDSYGEIANIIAGSLTTEFQEQFPKHFRIIRTRQEVISPAKEGFESDQPFPPCEYHHSLFPMSMAGAEMGHLHLILEAESLGLLGESDEQAEPAADQSATRTEKAAAVPFLEDGEEQAGGQRESSSSRAPVAPAKINLEKQKKLIDGLLELCAEKVGEEVTALIGDQLKLNNLTHNIYTKEELFNVSQGKQILTRMDIRGGATGEAYLLLQPAPAVFMGGSLIMLPEKELEEAVRSEEFGEDSQDAFGEVANIISGVYTAVFEEQYRGKIGFVKTNMETILPATIDPETNEILPNILYYASVGEIVFAGRDMGTFMVVFPASIFMLEGLAGGNEPEAVPAAAGAADSDTAQVSSERREQKTPAEATGGITGKREPTQILQEPTVPPDILIFSDDSEESSTLASALCRLGYHGKVLPYKSSVTANMNNAIRLVVIVMKEVSEQGFGVAIKVNAAGYQAPLIVAGPAWTRTLVIKAVKYGADDILVTPATQEDVQEKIEMNLRKRAA